MARSTGGNELTLDEIGDAIKNGEKVALVVCPSSESAIGIAAARRFAYALKTATSGCETVVHTSDDKIVRRPLCGAPHKQTFCAPPSIAYSIDSTISEAPSSLRLGTTLSTIDIPGR